MITSQSIKMDIVNFENKPPKQRTIENKGESKNFKDIVNKKVDEKIDRNLEVQNKNAMEAEDNNNEGDVKAKNSSLNETAIKDCNVDSESAEGTTGTKEKSDNEISNELNELLSLLIEKMKNTIVDKTSDENLVGISKDMQLLNSLLKNGKEPKLTEGLGLKLTAGKKDEVKELTTILTQLVTELKNGDLQENLKKNPQVLKELLQVAKGAVTAQSNQLETMSFRDLDSLKEMVKSVLDGVRAVKDNKFKNASKENLLITSTDINYIKEDSLVNRLTIKIANNQENKEPNLVKTEDKSSGSKDDAVLKKIIGDSEKKNENLLMFTPKFSEIKGVESIKDSLVINKNTVVNDVVKTVKYMIENNMKTLTVKMNPKDLGEITIKIVAQGESIKATITAASKDTVSLLNANEMDMKKMLDAQGVKISEVNISLYNEDTTFFREEAGFGGQNENQRQSENQNRTVINKELDDEKVNEVLNSTNNINMFA